MTRFFSTGPGPVAIDRAGGAGNDNLHGTGFADTLSGGGGADSLIGYGGNDVLLGNDGNDSLYGDDGDDTLYGGAGDDYLVDRSGANLFDGGDGDDSINAVRGYYDWYGDNTIDGGAGNDRITANGGNDVIRGGGGDDRIRLELDGATAYHVTVDGGDGDDAFIVDTGANAPASRIDITGGAGHDTYGWTSYHPATDALTVVDFQAGADGDRLDLASVFHARPWTVNPFAGGFVRLLASGADTLVQLDIDGPAGAQGFGTIAVLKGIAPQALTAANFVGGIGPDGGGAGPVLQGGAGNDTLAGGILADTIHGGGGDDVIEGGGGADWLYGDDGDDLIKPGIGATHMDGGAGNDQLVVDFGHDGNNVMDGGDGDDSLSVLGTGDNTLLGGRGNDSLSGGSGADTLDGGAGSDFLLGDAGNDVLYGGDGDDQLAGEAGDDTLSGGGGLDGANYMGDASAFVVTRDAAGLHVADQRVGDFFYTGNDTLLDIERVFFFDRAVAFDTAGTAGQAYRVYRAAFDRAPDLGGLGFWIDVMDKGVSLHDVAAGFVQSKEFADQYGAAPTNAAIVGKLYQNILHRAPEQAGYDFWLDVLDTQQADLASVVAAISDGAENQDAVAGLIAGGIAYTSYFG